MTVRTRLLGTLLLSLAVAAPALAWGASQAASQTAVPTPRCAASAEGLATPVATPGPSEEASSEETPPTDELVLPVATNPIANTATAPGLTIERVLVENNTDPATGKDAPDHLEIALRNESAQELSGFEVYYQITDLTTGDKEGYHCALAGFTIPADGERVVHLDDSGAPDHYPVNKFSLYHASLNEMQVDVVVSAAGVAPQTASVKKDAGGDENPDE